MNDESNTHWTTRGQLQALRIMVAALAQRAPDQTGLRQEYEQDARNFLDLLSSLPASDAAIATVEQQFRDLHGLVWTRQPPSAPHPGA